jgi:hypothetical protein
VAYVLQQVVDRKMVIGVAWGRGLDLATKHQDRHGKRETNVRCRSSQYGFNPASAQEVIGYRVDNDNNVVEGNQKANQVRLGGDYHRASI